jgi:hypothetical protein
VLEVCHPNSFSIVFIVNGQDVPLEVNPHEPLHAARNQALAKSHNTGRPPDEWEIRDERGNLLDPGARIESFNFGSGVRLFLTLRVGAGGAGARRPSGLSR